MIHLSHLEDMVEDEQPVVGLFYVSKSGIVATTQIRNNTHLTKFIPPMSVILLLENITYKSRFLYFSFFFQGKKYMFQESNLDCFASYFWRLRGQ